MFPIEGVVQKYAWGKKGKGSEVACLYEKSAENFKLEKETTYAELWLGTHVKAPSKVCATGEELSLFLKKLNENTEFPNNIKEEHFKECHLPFLLKVLSIEKSLSIQIHPNKTEASFLHKKDSKNYPDDNHKPEMTIALTPFEALCSFKPLPQILEHIKDVDELKMLVTKKFENLEEITIKLENEQHLKNFFTNLMNSDPQVVNTLANKLYQRILNNDLTSKDPSLDLFKRLMDQHPGDVGCFCAFFLNHITLQPGQSLFLGSNLPHAYISGDCIECMACSDNVIRAGLTGKYRDVETLCRLVDYTPMTPSQVLFSSSPGTHPAINTYNPPVPEFAVDKIQISGLFEPFLLPQVHSHSIILIVKGQIAIESGQKKMKISRGKSILVVYGSEVTLCPVAEETNGEHNSSNGEDKSANVDDVLLFRAYSTQ